VTGWSVVTRISCCGNLLHSNSVLNIPIFRLLNLEQSYQIQDATVPALRYVGDLDQNNSKVFTILCHGGRRQNGEFGKWRKKTWLIYCRESRWMGKLQNTYERKWRWARGNFSLIVIGHFSQVRKADQNLWRNGSWKILPMSKLITSHLENSLSNFLKGTKLLNRLLIICTNTSSRGLSLHQKLEYSPSIHPESDS